MLEIIHASALLRAYRFRKWEDREVFISTLIESIESNKLMYLYGNWHRGIGKSSFIANLSKEYDLPIITESKMQKRLFTDTLHVVDENVFIIVNKEDLGDREDKNYKLQEFIDKENRMYVLVDLSNNQSDILEKIYKYFDQNGIDGFVLGFVSDHVQYRLK